MSNGVTNSTPLVSRAQHQTLLDAADVLEHLATEADNDAKVGRAPADVADDIKIGRASCRERVL